MHRPLTLATYALCACLPLFTGCQTRSGQPAKLSTEPALDNGRLDRFAAALPFDHATVAVRILDLATGKELYAREPDRPMMPASNLKLLTTATALHLLGPDHTFDTFLAHKGDDLYLIGTGDPALGDPTIASWHKQKPTGHFETFAKALHDKALTRIKGNLYYDDHALDEQRIHPSWSKAFRDDWYAAPVAGLNFNDNCIDVTVYPTTPGQPVRYEVVPPTSRIKIVNNCKTSDTAHAPAIRRDTDDYTYVLSGTCKTTTTLQSKPVEDPGHFTADALKSYLQSRGITIEGQIIRAPRNPLLLSGLAVLATHRSNMKDVLARTNKNSQNMFAEALSKIAGSAFGPATWANGHKAIHAFLGQLGIDPAGVVAADGSGLSRDNRVTARVMSDLLLIMHPANTADPPRESRPQSLRNFAPSPAASQLWYDSLAEPGGIGTLRNRLKDMAGKLRGKTGSIGGVRALSGYLTTREDRTLIFSTVLNDIRGDETAAVVKVDNALRILAGMPTSTTAPSTQPRRR